MLRLLVRKARRMLAPRSLPMEARVGDIFPNCWPSCCAVWGLMRPSCTMLVSSWEALLTALVPRLLSAFFCSLLSMDISRLVNSYPAIASTRGRYLVRAASSWLEATSLPNRATTSCLLFSSANCWQASSVSTSWAVASSGVNVSRKASRQHEGKCELGHCVPNL